MNDEHSTVDGEITLAYDETLTPDATVSPLHGEHGEGVSDSFEWLGSLSNLNLQTLPRLQISSLRSSRSLPT